MKLGYTLLYVDDVEQTMAFYAKSLIKSLQEDWSALKKHPLQVVIKVLHQTSSSASRSWRILQTEAIISECGVN